MIYRIKIVKDGKFVRYANESEMELLRVNSNGIIEELCGHIFNENIIDAMCWRPVSATHEVEWGCVHEGIELYENDIVTAEYYLFQDEGKYNYHGLINYDKESHCMALVYVCVAKDRRGISDGIGNMLSEYEGLILIGNANLNPELLEEA